MKHQQRQSALGIDPRLVLVFELGASVDAAEFRRSGLRVVDSSDRRLIVAFADDPELAIFRERLAALKGGIPEGRSSEPYAQFFDAIDGIRPLEPRDRVTPQLVAAIGESGADKLRIDIECWHPGEFDLAREWVAEIRSGIESATGRVADALINDSAGLILLRAYVPGTRIMDIAELDAIARIDVLPQPALPMPTLYGIAAEDLPHAETPGADSPIVGLVDSGVASGHPLIGSSVMASDAIGSGIDDDQDEHGHGTMVASLLLHGDVQGAIARNSPMRPFCRLVSARVLNAENQFSLDDLWEKDLQEAIIWCADHGARIINLSIGERRSPYSPPRQLPGAAIVDDLARRHGLVVVVAAGNSRPADFVHPIDESAAHEYPKMLLANDMTGLLDPATSLLGLSVGGITAAAASGAQSSQETLRRLPMGKPNWPSPITRRGPGPGESIKPEVVERAGTLGIENGTLVSNDPELGVVGACAQAGRLLRWDVGTSYAAPLVSRVAAGVVARFPGFSAELVRALVLLSAERVPFADNLEEGSDSLRRQAERILVGYGRPSIGRATESTSHRALLVAEGSIPVNGVHIYEIPVPSSFMSSGGAGGLDIALAYSPRTRVRRLDYMASRMEFHVVRGLALSEVSRIFANLDDEEVPTPSGLGSKNLDLQPSTQDRSRGANQLGRKVFHQRLDTSNDTPMFLVVRNTNRWDDEHAQQLYAVAVALWRDEDQPEIHVELQALLEAEVEIPIEIELEP